MQIGDNTMKNNKKLTLSVLAIKNHPDICGVVEYLENLDLVPAQYGDLAFAMPRDNYADEYDAPIEWFKAFRAKYHCIWPNTGAGAYVAYSKSHGTIVALTESVEATGCKEMPTEAEQAIALYVLNLLEKNGYDRRNVDVVYTNDDDDDDPEYDPFKEMMDNMVPPAVAENMARDVLLRSIPEAKVADGNHEMHFDGAQVSMLDLPFTFAGEKFICRFKRTYKVTDKDREDFMFIWPENRPDDELCIKDPYNAREEVVNFYFKFDFYAESKYGETIPEFKATSQSVDLDGTIEWKGTYRGIPLTIKCRENKFYFRATGKGEGLFGGGFTYEQLKQHLENCIVPPEDTPEEPECPFCSGKEMDFGSESLHVQRAGNTREVNVYKEGHYAGCFEWKFCPLCSKPL